MSLPLHDVGSVKVTERTHSYFAACAEKQYSTVVAVMREVLERHVSEKLDAVSLAEEIHKSKQLGKLTRDNQ